MPPLVDLPLAGLKLEQADRFLHAVAMQSTDERISLAEWFNDLVYSLFIRRVWRIYIRWQCPTNILEAIGYPGLPASQRHQYSSSIEANPYPEAQTPKSIRGFS